MIANAKRILLLSLMTIVAVTGSAMINVQGILDRLKHQVANDSRVAIWNVNVNYKTMSVDGEVGFQEQKDLINSELDKLKVNLKNNIKVLSASIPANKKWAIVKLSIATLRCEPKHSAEVATQGIMGMPLRVIEKAGDWYRVQCPDQYIAFVPESSILFVTDEKMHDWNECDRYILTVYDDRLVTEPGGDETVTDLVMGNILKCEATAGEWIKLSTPDGRSGWVKSSSVENFETWAQQDLDLKKIEKTAKRMMGSSYLWGGTSTKVTDCSGLVKVSYFSNGIILQRDASQQALTGKKIPHWKNAQLGDLLFFGNKETRRVTHVGLYLHDGKYIHCSGQVKINDLNPGAPDYLYSPLSISRIDGMIGTKGIVYVRDHSWYFNEKK